MKQSGSTPQTPQEATHQVSIKRTKRNELRDITPRRLISLAAAAAYANVSTRTLRRYISQGRLTGYRVGPRLLKVDLRELDRLARPIPTAGASHSKQSLRRCPS